MRWQVLVVGLALAATNAIQASAGSVFVSAFDGPWSLTSNPSLSYGVGDNTPPVVLPLAPGATSVTITYESGLASAFGGTPPSVDALGYVGSPFCSGVGCTGIGSSGTPFPSFSIDPTNSGAPIYLLALIGAFTDASGGVIGLPFAPGDGPFTIAIPAGAVDLSLGANDDIFSDNSGGWTIGVTGVSSSVPEPSTWAMMIAGFAGLGWLGYSRRHAIRSAAA